MKHYTCLAERRSRTGWHWYTPCMNEAAYLAVIGKVKGAGLRKLPFEFLQVTGKDRTQFLQGQVSNDVLSIAPRQKVDACLLNNTGHLLAYLSIYGREEKLLLQTDESRAEIIKKTLERFIVRERIEIQPADLVLITLQGSGAEGEESDNPAFFVNLRRRYGAAFGVDLIVDRRDADEAIAGILNRDETYVIDDETANILRVESGEPAWGAELDESIIPLEAGLDFAISYTKGCYMGQEIIARIHSRGHTNRTLVGLKLDEKLELGSLLVAVDGERKGENIARITSVAVSPRFGPIALAYVRNEYSAPGKVLATLNGGAVVSNLPFQPGE